MFQGRYIRFLESQVEKLQEENSKLREALIAKESPMAYADQHSKDTSIDPETKKRLDEERKVMNRYMAAMEGPLFQNADEMLDLLARTIGPVQPKSVHGNSES